VLFNCSLTPAELAGTRALSYIKSGERAGLPAADVFARVISVARERKPAPLIFLSKVGERCGSFECARVFEDKKLYGVSSARCFGAGPRWRC
jgi:hypothetical protein